MNTPPQTTYPAEPPPRSSSAAVFIAVAAAVVVLVVPLMVAVIGILAAIAIPNFIVYTQRAKIAEADSMLAVIARAEEDARVRDGHYTACSMAPDPAADPPSPHVRFVPTEPCWSLLGVTFGDQYCSYAVDVDGDPASSDHTYAAQAVCDVDGDLVWAEFQRGPGDVRAVQLNPGEY